MAEMLFTRPSDWPGVLSSWRPVRARSATIAGSSRIEQLRRDEPWPEGMPLRVSAEHKWLNQNVRPGRPCCWWATRPRSTWRCRFTTTLASTIACSATGCLASRPTSAADNWRAARSHMSSSIGPRFAATDRPATMDLIHGSSGNLLEELVQQGFSVSRCRRLGPHHRWPPGRDFTRCPARAHSSRRAGDERRLAEPATTAGQPRNAPIPANTPACRPSSPWRRESRCRTKPCVNSSAAGIDRQNANDDEQSNSRGGRNAATARHAKTARPPNAAAWSSLSRCGIAGA